MSNDVQRLNELMRQGRCCSAALVQMGLERAGREDPLLLQAVSGLCGGIQNGMVCGALTGAACMLNLVAPGAANDALVPELAEWFVATMGDRYGGPSCAQIVAGDPMNKSVRCPAVVEATLSLIHI